MNQKIILKQVKLKLLSIRNNIIALLEIKWYIEIVEPPLYKHKPMQI